MVNILLGLLLAYSVAISPNSDGSQLVYVGAAMNLVAVATNGWQMPVFAPEVTKKKLEERDPFHRHKLGDVNTNFKFLCDWLDFGVIIMSPGDMLMSYGAFMNYGKISLSRNTISVQFNW